MNIFYLPSWWPTSRHPFHGIFFKEQIERIAELYPNHNFHVLYWGHPELEIKPFSFWTCLKNLISFSKLATPPNKLGNLFFYQFPILFPPRKLGGLFIQTLFIKKFFKKLLGQHKIDLIHSMVGHPAGIVAQRLSKTFHVPYLITEVMGPFPFPHLRNSDNTIWKPLLNAYQQANMNIADGLVKLATMQSENIPNCVYIPNFVNEFLFDIGTSIEFSSEKKIRFFTLAGYVHGKGIDVLLHAIAKLENKEEFIFAIGGGGPLKESLKNLAITLKIDHLIEWHGHLDRQQAVEQFQRCQAFILPSRHESFGIVYIEAMFCGRPVIATRCGGPEEYVLPHNGLLCNLDDAEDLANAIQLMAKNIAHYDSQKIRDWALERYSSKNVCAQILKNYAQVLENTKSS